LDGLVGDEKQGPDVPGIEWGEGSLDSLLAAGVHAGFARNLGWWTTTPRADWSPLSSQRNYNGNTMAARMVSVLIRPVMKFDRNEYRNYIN
jgi:hypothetical protein